MRPDRGIDEITVFLKRISAGDKDAEAPLAEAVYGRMRRIARGVMSGQPPGFSLQPTELVNQVLIEIMRLSSIEWQDRVHFFRVAARLLRRRFLDYIRRKRSPSRIPEGSIVELRDELIVLSEDRFDDILLVNRGLDELELFDAELAETIEMVYFGGFSIAQVAAVRGVNEKTIDRHLELARRWMRKTFGYKCPHLQSTCAS